MNAPLTPTSLLPTGEHAGAAALREFVTGLDALADDTGVDGAERQRRLQDQRTALADADSDLARRLAEAAIPTRQADQLIQARMRHADGLRIATWGELLTHAGYAAAPLARILLAWEDNGDPAAARALESLCVGLDLLEGILSAKRDYTAFDRVFLPQAFFRDAAIGVERLSGARAEGQIRAVLDRALDGVDHLLIEARPAPGLLSDPAARRSVRQTLCAARRLARLSRRRDPFAGPVALAAWDRFVCALQALHP